MIRIKRVYDPPNETDGLRILVDRLWPRGLTKDKAKIDLWIADLAPSDQLRKWFAHEPAKWTEFKKHYFEELKDKNEQIKKILDKAKVGTATLLFGAREEKYNNAAALQEYLEQNRF